MHQPERAIEVKAAAPEGMRGRQTAVSGRHCIQLRFGMIRTAVCLFVLALPIAACQRQPSTAKPGEPAGASDSRVGFAITSPKAGDTLVEGQTYQITWLAPDSFRINVGAVMGGKDMGMILTNVAAHSGSASWTVPNGFVTGFGPASSDQVRLRMENAADPEQWTEAGPLVVRGAAPR